MQKITSVTELKSAISALEMEHSVKTRVLKEQAALTYESLRPANLIRSVVKDLFSSSSSYEDMSGITAGLASGFLINKFFVGKSGGALKKLFGSLLQTVITTVMTRNSDFIRSAGQMVLHFFSGRRKEKASEEAE
jgi:hypothetical protein